MKNWMLFLVFLSSARIGNACSWWPEGEDVRFSLFSSSLADGDDMSDLFYSAHLFNNYMVDDYAGPTENLTEWYNYFGQKFSIQDIDQLIYHFPVTKPMDGLKDNPLMRYLKGGGNPEALEYILFSKQLEEYLSFDYWEEDEIDVDGVIASTDFAEKKLSTVKDPQIRMRYAFQLCVMYYYLGQPEKVEHYYKQEVLAYPQESVIKYWAEFFYANTLPTDQRLYHLALVFDHSKSKNRYIFQHYPSNKSDVQGALKLCKSDEEKAAILSILAFKNPGRAKDQIIEIGQLNANNELMDILLIREINKMEDWYLTQHYTSYGPAINNYWGDNEQFAFIAEKNFQSDKAYLKSFRAAMEKIFQDKKVKNREVWYTSFAYMAYMLDDQKGTENFLKLADQCAQTAEVKGQIAVIDLLNLVKHEDGWDEKFQHKLMLGMKKVEEYKADLYRFDRFKAQLMLAISRKYLESDQLVLAALFESKVTGGDIYEVYSWWSEDQKGYQAFELLDANATSADLDALFEFWEKPDKTPLEQWLMQDMIPFKWRFADLRATQYFREDKLVEALKIYETIPDSVWHVYNSTLHYYYDQELKNDPFETNIYGRGYGPNWGKTYTKPEFVKEIMRLKGLVDGAVKDKAYYALLLGNAYYNMSYNGNSYYYTEYSWGYTYGGYFDDEGKRDRTDYYTSKKALEYYQMAEQFAPNEAYAAFCHRLQLKCMADSYYYSTGDWDESQKKILKDWEVFATMYPNHANKLRNCDHFEYYSNAWKQG